MKLTYVILTCEAYIPTRCKWALDSWISRIHNDDSYVFLSSNPNPEKNVVGWNGPDSYDGCSRKYYDFVRNMNIDADWIVFVDDDTFVFPNRLRSVLESYSPTQKIYMGKLLYGLVPTMSGGGGFCVSASLFKDIQTYVRTNNIVLDTKYSDVSIGQWIMKQPYKIYIWDNRFNSHPHTEEGSIDTALTFHYVTQPLFQYYKQFL